MLIALKNESTRVTDAQLKAIASAVDFQMRAHVAPAWGRLPPKVYFAGAGPHAVWVPGSWVFEIVDALPEAPDALGYHTELADGSILAKIGVGPVLDSPGGTVFTGPNSVAAVISHEAIEAFLDADVNLWADAADGYAYPVEGADAVQGDSYPLGGTVVHGSNFLHPSWFDPMGKAPFDHLGKLRHPFTLGAGGYTVRRKQGSGETEIFGARPSWKQATRSAIRAA